MSSAALKVDDVRFMPTSRLRKYDLNSMSSKDMLKIILSNPESIDCLPIYNMEGFEIFMVLSYFPELVSKMDLDKLNEWQKAKLSYTHNELSDWLSINE